MIKIIHTGDLHLDAPFTLDDPSRARERRDELRESFRALTAYIRDEGIELCLMAGDLTERGYATKETADLLASEFAACPGCRFVIAPGNHDYYRPDGFYAGGGFPKNVYVFTETAPSSFDFPELGCTVYGFAFTAPYLDRNPMQGVRPDDPSRINVLCAHADTSSPISRYCPMTERDIVDCGFDYAALGHIHNSRGIKHEGNVYWAYCGALEGRDYSESGYKGAITGTLDKRDGLLSVSLRGMRFSRRRYADDRLNVTGAAEPAEAAEALSALIARNGYGSDTLLRVTFEGSVSPSFSVSKSDLSVAADGLYSFEPIDATVPLFDREKLERDSTIRGAFYRRLRPDLEHGTPEERARAAAALRYGLAALDGNEFVDF